MGKKTTGERVRAEPRPRTRSARRTKPLTSLCPVSGPPPGNGCSLCTYYSGFMVDCGSEALVSVNGAGCGRGSVSEAAWQWREQRLSVQNRRNGSDQPELHNRIKYGRRTEPYPEIPGAGHHGKCSLRGGACHVTGGGAGAHTVYTGNRIWGLKHYTCLSCL